MGAWVGEGVVGAFVGAFVGEGVFGAEVPKRLQASLPLLKKN
jgi:hypothetical protein